MRNPLYPGQWSNTSGANTLDEASADFNGDRIKDIVVVGLDGTDILFGNGNGTFQPAIKISSVSASHVVLGDFNNDGHTDIVTEGSQPVILFGQGDGNFSPPKNIAKYSIEFVNIAAADFNNDGNEDIVLLTKGGFRLYLGNDNGTFTPSTSESWQADASYGLVVADFNKDGNEDIALTHVYYKSSVYLGNGDGTFRQPAAYTVGSWPDRIYSGDFNGDGYPDLITENQNSYDISLLINNGNGTFQAQQRYRVGNTPMGGVFKDINGDGYADFVAGVFTAGGPSIFQGNAEGTLNPPSLGHLGAGVSSPLLTDLNGDGHDDLVTTQGGNGWIARYLGNPEENFQSDKSVQTTLFTSNAIVHADFNNDGKTDIAAVGDGLSLYRNLIVSLGSGDGTFQNAKTLQTLGESAASLAVGDVNKDSNQDIVTIENNTTYPQKALLVTYIGNGDGTFQTGQSYPAGIEDTRLILADLNHDGYPDAIVHDIGSETSSSIGVLLNNGDGSFAAPVTYSSPNPQFMALGDLNADGNPDLAVLGDAVEGTYLAVMQGHADGTFTTQNTYIFPDSDNVVPNGIGIRDLNKDGIADIVVSNAFGSILVLLGNGDGTFQSPVTYNLSFGSTPSAIAFADEDQDGNIDILVKNGSSFDVLFGDGSGNFPRQERYSAGPDSGFAIFDANGDGLPDVITMAHDPDANNGFQDVYVSLHLPPKLAFTGTRYSITGGKILNASVTAVDPSNLPVTYSAITQSAHGSVTMQTGGSFSYSPDPGFSGRDIFSVKATDGTSTARTIAIVNVAVPSPPSISGLPANVDIDEGNPVPSISFSLTGTNPLTFAASSSDTELLPNSAIKWNSDCVTAHTCTLNLDPSTKQTGDTAVELTVTDSYDQSTSQSFVLHIQNNSSGGGSGGGGGATTPIVLLALITLWMMELVCVEVRKRNKYQPEINGVSSV